MSSSDVSNEPANEIPGVEPAIEIPGVKSVDMKLEVIVVPFPTSIGPRASTTERSGGGWMAT